MNRELAEQRNSCLWDIPRLANYLSVPVGTIRDWVYKRSIPFVRAGRHIRFMPKDIEGWLENRRVEPHRPR